MTYRERLADLISGGALTRNQALIRALDADRARWRTHCNDGWVTATTRLLALQAIIANDTPKANATVKRIVEIAKEALE